MNSCLFSFSSILGRVYQLHVSAKTYPVFKLTKNDNDIEKKHPKTYVCIFKNDAIPVNFGVYQLKQLRDEIKYILFV